MYVALRTGEIISNTLDNMHNDTDSHTGWKSRKEVSAFAHN